MAVLTPFVQDAIVTGIAILAFVILVRRLVGIVRPSPSDASCGACASCPAPKPQAEGLTTVVPLDGLRRAGGRALVSRPTTHS